MRIWNLVAGLLFAGPAWASSYYLTDNLTTVDPLKWSAVGTISPNGVGLSAPDSAGGSLISRIPIPDGTAEAEVRMTLHLTGSGGTYTQFLQATPDSRTGGSGGGTHLAFEMQNPQMDGQGHCTANFVVLQTSGGVVTLLSAFQHACRDGMELRMAVHGGVALLWPDEAMPVELPVAGAGIGQPGIGAYGTPAGNAISQVQLGLISRSIPPAVDKQKIGVSTFRNHVDVQWPAAHEDASGTGVASYWIARDGQYLMRTSSPMFQDLTVKPGESHVYSIAVVDQHYNFSAPVTFTVSTPVPIIGSPPSGLPIPPKLPR